MGWVHTPVRLRHWLAPWQKGRRWASAAQDAQRHVRGIRSPVYLGGRIKTPARVSSVSVRAGVGR